MTNYLVYLQGGLYTDITPATVLSLPPFIDEQTSTMCRWGVFEKNWATDEPLLVLRRERKSKWLSALQKADFIRER